MVKTMLSDPEDVVIALGHITSEKTKQDWEKGKSEYIERSGNNANAVNYMANKYCHSATAGGNGDLYRRLEEKIARHYENRS